MSQPQDILTGPAIAAIWTPKRVMVAASSHSGMRPAQHFHEAGQIHFTASGLLAYAATGFDALSIIAAALQPESGMSKRLSQAAEELEPLLTAAAQHLHDQRPEDFKKHLAGKNALEILFFFYSEGEVTLSQLGFKTKKRGKEVVLQAQRKDYPNAATDIMSVELLTAGVAGAVDEAFCKNTRSQQALVYPEQALQQFAARAIAAEPAQAGYPVHMVRLTAEGATRLDVEDEGSAPA